MARLVSGNEGDGGNRQKDADAGVELVKVREEGEQVELGLLEGEIHELIKVGVVVSSADSRSQGVDLAGGAVPPGFGEAERKNQDVGVKKDGAHVRDVRLPRVLKGFQRGKAFGLDVGPQGVGKALVFAQPCGNGGRSAAEGLVKQLAELADGVDVSVPGGEGAVLQRLLFVRRKMRA